MRCQNCGSENVSFHYTANINGNVTERHLCAECAAKLGYSRRLMSASEMPFEEMFMDFFGLRPGRRPFGGYGMLFPTFPTFIVPTVGVILPNAGAEEAAGARPDDAVKPEIDEEMKRRREINVLREEMRKAAEAEDFERAAAIRDRIKRLEGEQTT